MDDVFRQMPFLLGANAEICWNSGDGIGGSYCSPFVPHSPGIGGLYVPSCRREFLAH